MNRKLLFGVSVFVALVGIALVDSGAQVSAGHGCRGGLFGRHRQACGGYVACGGARHHRHRGGGACCGVAVPTCCAPVQCAPVAGCCGQPVPNCGGHAVMEGSAQPGTTTAPEGEAAPDVPPPPPAEGVQPAEGGDAAPPAPEAGNGTAAVKAPIQYYRVVYRR